MGTETLYIPAKMDIRGFVRIQDIVLKKLQIEKAEFADLYIDKVGKRIGIVFDQKLKETSFRVIQNPASIIVYLKGAMKEVGLSIVPGAYTLITENDKIVFSGPKKQDATIPEQKGEWELFSCRNSAGLTMISIDTRGTLILDKRTCTEINTKENNTFNAEYNAKKKTFLLTFGKEGFSNVRTIASHANASFMGTLTSNGVALPKTRLRTSCVVKDNTLTFSIANMQTKEIKEEK